MPVLAAFAMATPDVHSVEERGIEKRDLTGVLTHITYALFDIGQLNITVSLLGS